MACKCGVNINKTKTKKNTTKDLWITAANVTSQASESSAYANTNYQGQCGKVISRGGASREREENVHVANFCVGAGAGTDDRDPPDDHGGTFGDLTFIICEFWRGQMETAGVR